MKPPENLGLAERILWYVETDQEQKAEALAMLGDWLEDCASYELEFYSPHSTS